jgi:hypothetical protein
MLSAQTVYSTLLTAFTVHDIAHPLRLVPTTLDHEDALNEIGWATSLEDLDFVAVQKDGRTVGLLSIDSRFFDEERWEGITDEFIEPIPTDRIVSSSLPLLEFLGLLTKRPFWYVLTPAGVTHYASFREIDTHPMRLSLFGLVCSIERSLIEILAHRGPASDLFRRLEGPRQRAAEFAYRRQFARDLPPVPAPLAVGDHEDKSRREAEAEYYRLVACCLSLSDRFHLLLSLHPALIAPFHDEEPAQQFATLLVNLRNAIVHQNPLPNIDTPEALFDMVSEVLHVESELSMALPEIMSGSAAR